MHVSTIQKDENRAILFMYSPENPTCRSRIIGLAVARAKHTVQTPILPEPVRHVTRTEN
jgi:hypothetical protein